eukprot:sb/3475338/
MLRVHLGEIFVECPLSPPYGSSNSSGNRFVVSKNAGVTGFWSEKYDDQYNMENGECRFWPFFSPQVLGSSQRSPNGPFWKRARSRWNALQGHRVGSVISCQANALTTVLARIGSGQCSDRSSGILGN